MKKTALVIMAAGLGSRFGKGIKQLAKVGPSGEIIMEYSIHDALEAGFNKVVFIIRKDIEKEFKEIIGDKIEKVAEVAYVYQDLNDLPEGFTCPEDRTKPWGTGQAVLAAKKAVQEPFLVINADDYYGKEAFGKIHDYLVEEKEAGEKMDICMAGFILENTLSDNGGVTRGVCALNPDRKLVGITETYNIQKTEEGPAAVDEETGEKNYLDAQTLVSMNMWGFQPEFMEVLEKGFVEFLAGVQPGDIKKEYLLPGVVDQMIKEGKAEVSVLKTHDTWFGVTYQEDKEIVMKSFKELEEKGVYTNPLFPQA
ncbi:nucleotidyltransferase family protein [Blautia sp. An46]|uniref:nucleotidyltransferase family protein n=1 Tax=Blautia sp. An46 TaxID=1965636 RepID=UPI000B39526D|nr:sugar phosphate nucleotidyltransferase [Blautia sp. An46]OUN90324.1 nucleotidyltransferase [Blautia sp. An46]